jgi:hypothetical protein
MAPQALYIRLGELFSREAAIWNEGTAPHFWPPDIRLTSYQITFIFILILFVDSVNRVYRVQVELTGMGNDQRG